MRSYPLPVVVGAAALGLAAGTLLGWWLAPEAGGGGVVLAPRVGGAGGSVSAPATVVHALPPTGTAALKPAQTEAAPAAAAGQVLDEHALRERAARDPVELRKLVDRLETETDPVARDQLKAVLGAIDKPEAVAAFRRLATSSDASRRRDAYEMLQHAPESAEIRGILRQAMASEQSPEGLVVAIGALRPAAVDPAEGKAIIGQLGALTQHPNAAVRSQSLQQLGQWDRTGEGRERYAQALADPAPEVRQAAIFAIAQSGVRGDSVKAGLFAVLNGQGESREVRGSALQALERFPLSQQEYAALAEARQRFGPP